MSAQPDLLVDRCNALLEGAGAAIGWVADARGNSRRLDRDADGLIEGLRRDRNLARRLRAAARLPMSVGFFGPSQAGKSYLVSALARGPNGLLETVLDGDRLDFIEHINPYGGGKEATGLVTRFTRRAADELPGYPVRLLLLSEADVIKVLGNSFFNDFDRERVRFNTDPEHIRGLIAPLEARRQRAATGGLDEDDVIDIRDYFEHRFEASMEALAGDYWPSAVTLAPYLLPADRATLFSVLWGEIPDLTAAYHQLRGWLDALGHAREVRAPRTALVRQTATGLAKADSILNVAILNLLGKDDADQLTVVPVVDGQPGTEAALPRSLLAALTMEMTFALASPPRAALLETVDLIDFPGYRARLQVTNLEEVRKLPDVTDPVAELILRGKVAYLFERYTDDQQMNVLLLCVPSDGQIEVPALRPALDAWVKLTQGADAGERARAAPGLMWIVTKFDRRLEPKPGESENNLREGWDGLMSQALLERFGTADWLREWGSGPFDNVFLVRKPGMAAGIVNCDGSGREIGVDATQRDRLDLLRRTFLEREVVRKHVHDAEAAFDAMLALDDGGMTRVTAYLDRVARVEHKLARIARQVERLTEDLTQGRLGAYFRAEGAEEAERKRQIAEMIVAAIRGRVRDNPSSFAELLLALQPVPESLRGLYLHTEARADPAGETAPAKAARGTLFDPDEFDFGDAPATSRAAAPPAVGRRAAVFARAAVSDWTGRLRRMPDSPELHRVLGLTGEVLQALVDELVTGAMRLGLEERLAAALHQAEVRAGTVRARLADQQVLVAATLLDEYVDYLGCAALPLEQRPAWELRGQRRVVFTPPAPIAENALPVLGPSPFNYSALFIMDWLAAFRSLVIGNAGHAAGQELTAEQNARLGRILQRIAGATLGPAPGAPAGA